MRSKSTLTFFIIIFIVFLVVSIPRCTSSPTQVSGSSSTEVSTFTIIGLVTDTAGVPVNGAKVYLRPKDFLSKRNQSSDTAKKEIFRDLITDKDGRFVVDSVPANSYLIEVFHVSSNGDSLGALLSCDVTEEDSVKYLADTVRLMATVAGNVEVINVDSLEESSVQVQVYGLERLVKADSIGEFKVRVPRGTHKIKVSVGKKEYNEIEVLERDIPPGGFRHIGKLELYHKKTPPPCSDYSCDSLAVRVILDNAGHYSVPVDSVTVKSNGRIRELHLRGLGLDMKLKELSRLSEVEVLDLGDNNLSGRLFFLNRMKFLKELYLDNNSLGHLSRKSFNHLYWLYILDLSDNNLNSLPYTITYLMPDSILDLSNNYLCDTLADYAEWADIYDPDWKDTQNCQ